MRRTSKWQCNTRWLKRAIVYVTVLCSVWLCLQFFLREGSSETTAVVILGGGVTKEGTVPEHTQLRLDLAFELYQQLGERALFFPLSGGTPHKPNPVDVRGFPYGSAPPRPRGSSRWACLRSKSMKKALHSTLLAM